MGWEDTILQKTAEVVGRTSASGPRRPWIGFLLRMPPEAHIALRQIAKDRDVAMTTYLRRLLIMAIAKERGEPLHLWLSRLPGPAAFGQEHVAPHVKAERRDTGSGMEGMCTHPGCDEIHL